MIRSWEKSTNVVFGVNLAQNLPWCDPKYIFFKNRAPSHFGNKVCYFHAKKSEKLMMQSREMSTNIVFGVNLGPKLAIWRPQIFFSKN